MAKRAVKTGRRVINPMFAIPDGVDELYYDENILADETDEDNFAEESDADAGIDYSDQPDTPQVLQVVEQIVRMDASGNEVVDLIVEVEDVGVEDYEFHVTKT